MTPSIAVIIPTYNRESTILRAVESVLNQTHQDFELVIVDDGSNDNTGDVLAAMKDSRIRYVYQQNRGRSAARNQGVANSNAPILVFLDSDDEAMPLWLELILKGMEDPSAGVVCCGYKDSLNSRMNKTDIILPHYRGPMYGNNAVLFRPPGTFALRREIFNGAGGYAEALSFSENTELAMRVVEYCVEHNFRIISIQEPLLYYHRAPERKAKKVEEFQTLFNSAHFILQKHGSRLRSRFPRGYANYSAIAGVNALRLGEIAQARKFLWHALEYDPYRLKHYARFMLSLFPFLGRRFWLRFAR